MAANVAGVKAKVQEILANKFSGVELTKDGGLTLRNESARAFIRVWENGDRAIINVEAPLLFKVKATPELFKHVALHADDYIFGHLSAKETDDGVMVLFTHSLLGDYLDSEELASTVIGILGVGNSIDDELQKQFGGEVFHDE